MSRWSDQFNGHPFHTDWVTLAGMLEEAASADIKDAEEYARLKKVAVFVKGLIDGMDPEIVGVSVLNNMHSALLNTIAEVSGYFSNRNVAHLANANAHMDTLVTYVSQTPFMAFGTAKAALTKAAGAYAEAMHSYAEKYSQDVGALADAAISDYTQLDTRAAVATTEIEKLEARVTTMEAALPLQLAGYNSDFQTSEKARNDKHETWIALFQEKVDRQFTEAATKFTVGQDTMGAYLEQAQKVLGSVVDTGQAGAYATYASQEKKSANVFRLLAIVLMVVAALVLFLPELANAAKAAAEYEMDWKKALYRLPFSLILFAPAIYLAKESSKHRTNEVLNRRRQHILTTIGPYLALLTAEKADQIKAEVAKSIFADNLPGMGEKAPETANVIAQVTNLVDTISKTGK